MRPRRGSCKLGHGTEAGTEGRQEVVNPYAKDLGSRDPIVALGETPERIRDVVGRMTPGDFGRSYASDKWDARRILLHLAHTEMAFGMRLRMALATAHYVVQPFDQDAWMAREPPLEGLTALGAYLELRRLNLPLFRSLTPEERGRTIWHPERGPVTIGWIVELLGGHDLHHLAQLEQILAEGRN
jgi:hypothetical protein